MLSLSKLNHCHCPSIPSRRTCLVRPPLMMAAGSRSGTWPDGVRMLSDIELATAVAYYLRVLAGKERSDLWLQGILVPNAFNIKDDIQEEVSCYNEASEETRAHYKDAYYEPWSHISGVKWPDAPPPQSDPFWQEGVAQELAKAVSEMTAPGAVLKDELAKVNALNVRGADRKTDLWKAAVAVHAESTSLLYNQLKARITAGQAAARVVSDAWVQKVSWEIFITHNLGI